MARSKEKGSRGIGPSTGKDSLPVGKSWFLGIGINDYQHFPPLNNAVRDVEALRSLLQDRYDLDQAELLSNKDATRRNILRKLDELSMKVKPADKLIIYFSGHGYLSAGGLGFWVPVDAETGYTDDYIPNSRLRDYLLEIRSRHTLLISDACFSGALFAKGPMRRLPEAEEILEGKISRYGFCSGRSNEEVYDGPVGEHSPFAGSILAVLQENTAARLRVSLLAEEVMSRTAAQYRQLPHHGTLFDVGDQGGQYVFRLRSDEQSIWDHAKGVNRFQGYNRYLEQFPHGKYADEALLRIQLLEEEQEWQKAERIDRISAYQAYLRNFPQGSHVATARTRISELEQASLQAPATIPKPTGGPAPYKALAVQPNTFTDPRDGQIYRTVALNGLRWLAQNLNFDAGKDCWMYDDDPKHGEKYGRLYTWQTAQKACPPGWRLPTDEEWRSLAMAQGGLWDGDDKGDPKKAYKALMEGGSSGFSALLGGYRDTDGRFHYLGDTGNYWSVTEYGSNGAWLYAYTYRSYGKLARGNFSKAFGFSCRCVQA